jgi:DNA-binding beta-propeller fold protein YncE
MLLFGAAVLVTVMRRRRRARAGRRVTAPGVGIVLAAIALPAAIAGGGCGREIPAYALDRGFGPTDPTLPGMHGRIVTSNNGDDTLSIVDPDPAATAPAFSLPVGLVPIEPEGPHHIAAAPDGSAVYLNLSRTTLMGLGPHGSHGTSARPGYVLKLDARDGRLLGRVSVDTNPGENALDAAGRTLYVTHYDLAAWTVGARAGDFRQGDSTVIAIDTESMSIRFRLPVCPAAHGARLSRDQKTLYVACAPDEIALVALDSAPPVVRRVTLPGLSEGAGCVRCPYAVAVAPDDTVWVASLGRNSGVQGGGGVDVFDPKAPAVAGPNGVDAGGAGGAGGSTGGADESTTELAAPSTGATGAFNPAWRLDFIGAAMFPAFLAPDGDGRYRALVPEQGPGGDHLHIYEVAPGGPPVLLDSIAFNRADCYNAHVAEVSSDQATAYLICEGDHKRPGSLVVVDLASRAPIRVVTLGVFPDGMAMVPDRQAAQ